MIELKDGILQVDSFLTVTLGIIVLFVGKRLNDALGFLRAFSIPEPVTGGLLFSILFGVANAMANMAAAAQRYGASHLAFIIIPLVCAVFIDLANALLIPFFLASF
jgi:Na+/glutamate symporter